MNKLNSIKRVAQMLKVSRYRSELSQEQIAKLLNVSKKTVQNWEAGITCPSFIQVFDWLNATNQPPYPYMMAYLHTSQIAVPDVTAEGEAIKKALHTQIDSINEHSHKKLLYCLTGKHGSSPDGALDAFTCFLHLPLIARISMAEAVCTNYELAEATGKIVCPDSVKPNTELLKALIRSAKQAVKDGRETYIFGGDDQ